MPSRRVRLRFHVQRITCPGVYLCSRSADVELTVSALNTHRKTNKQLPPSFPMCVHETFSMERSYDASDLTALSNAGDDRFIDGPTNDGDDEAQIRALSRIIAKEPVTFTLWHCSRRLAHLTTNIADIQRQNSSAERLNNDAIQPILLMTTRHFPGSIAPRLEVTASAELIDTCACCQSAITMDIANSATTVAAAAKRMSAPLSRWSFSSKEQQRQRRPNCLPPFTLVADFDERNRPNGMRQRPVCHGDRMNDDGNGDITELYFRQKPPRSLCIDGIVCSRCQDRCRTQLPNNKSNPWKLSCKDPNQQCCPHMQIRPHEHDQQQQLHYSLSNTTLWLQQIHPEECGICTKYRTYFQTAAEPVPLAAWSDSSTIS